VGEVWTLADACDRIVDCAHKTAPVDELGEYFAVGTPAMRGNVINYAEARRISLGTFEAWTERLRPEHGDLLLAREAPVGPVVRIPERGNVAPGQRTVLLRPRGSVVDSRYLFYYLTSPLGQSELLVKASGSTVSHLNVADVRQLPILRLPALDEQRAIAQVLGALDDKITANEKVTSTAFDLAHSMVLEVLKRTRGADCLLTKFGRLGDLFDGPHATPTRCGVGPYFLNISSLKSGRLDLAESDHLSESEFSKWTRRVTPQEGDLLFSYETRLGEAALMPAGVRACLGRRMALLRADRERVLPEFLLHFYLSHTFQRTIAERTIHGATVPRIGLATMGDWDVEIPELAEQQSIAATLRSLHAVVDHVGREAARLARTRDELLPLLMSGKIRVKDAEAVASEVV
jgi:type I restriction enzyme S subunit